MSISSRLLRRWRPSRLSLPEPTSPSGRAPAGQEGTPRRGRRGAGGGRAPSLGVLSCSGGGWGWGTRIGGARNSNSGAIRAGRGMRTCNDDGARGGARESGRGALGSCGGTSGSGSGASGAWGRMRRGGLVRRGRAVGRSVLRGWERERVRLWERAPPGVRPGHSRAVCGAWRPRAVVPGTRGGGGGLSMDLPRRGFVPGVVRVAAAAASGTGPVVVGGVVLCRGWLGGAGLLPRGRGGRADTFPGRVGGPLWR